jgi:hypothetical protein
MDLRSLQKPLKEQYRKDPNCSLITLRAKGAQTDRRSNIKMKTNALKADGDVF